jgi:ABC-2 type transport system ATP-binding protein
VTAIEVRDLRKLYGPNEAVAGVSLSIAEGEVYGLLGHNGAGKSTTVEILEGHRTRTSGDVSVIGMDPADAGRELRDRIGIVLQTSAVEKELTVREALAFYGSCYRRRRPVDDVIEMIDLADKLDARIGTLSGGQRRRLDLGLGIIGDPDVLFLDEPTTGFDPVARRQSWQLVQRLCEGGTTVLLTTHYLDEAEHLADRVGVLTAGRLVAEGTPDELMAATPDTTISFELPAGVEPGALSIPADAGFDGPTVRIETSRPTSVLAEITGAAAARGIELAGLSVRRPSLEDVFLALGNHHGDQHGDQHGDSAGDGASEVGA